MNFCFFCQMDNYSDEKYFDDEFFLERKNEFYPEEIFGNSIGACNKHYVMYKLWESLQPLD